MSQYYGFSVNHSGDLASTDIIKFVMKKFGEDWLSIKFAVLNDRKYRISPVEVEFWFQAPIDDEQYKKFKQLLPSSDKTVVHWIK